MGLHCEFKVDVLGIWSVVVGNLEVYTPHIVRIGDNPNADRCTFWWGYITGQKELIDM
jgi:hypothetical protein